ncbi:tetratricopeptide repeat protein [Aureispira anguillae]|uniref:Tetratricopeptide repeat protein n=1 Tax=Aureispira anguillae TaxID=2864201 RepID=A0A916DNH9_9BACT|nr:tetratricopeptide repeat protein [Aureispira anguillae]BDS09894.1 tetratricopeptide repeat protein [Aureispira anguillae]
MTEKELLEREELLEDILDALEDGDYEEAEDLADEAIEAFPNEAFGYYYVGEAMFLQGDVDDAVAYYQQAVDKAADNPDYKSRLALMYAKLEEEEKAKQIYAGILAIHDGHVDSLVAMGVYAINDDAPEDALNYLDKALEVSPDYGDAYKIRAIVHTNLNNYEEALDDINKALKMAPDDQELWLQKINLHDISGDAVATENAFSEWVELNPEDADRHKAQADFYVGQNNYKAAEKSFDLAIEKQLYGDFAAINSILGRGWARLHQNNTSAAVDDFSRVIELDAKIADSYIGIAEAKAKDGAIDAASTYLDLGIDIVLDNKWMLYNKKGVIHTQAGNWEMAEAAFQALLEMDDEEINAEGHFSMGKLYQTKGDLEAAFRSWRKASDIFHLEAEECIEKYCSNFLGIELKEKEALLLDEMQEAFKTNKQSQILKPLFHKFWKVDIKATSAKNEMFAQMPAKMEKQILGLLDNICLSIVHKGVMVLNPGQDSVRMLYQIKEEAAKSVTINGVPLNGTDERDFTLGLAGDHLTLRGFGDEDADINLYLNEVTVSQLPKNTQNELKKLASAGDLDFMGDEFKGMI